MTVNNFNCIGFIDLVDKASFVEASFTLITLDFEGSFRKEYFYYGEVIAIVTSDIKKNEVISVTAIDLDSYSEQISIEGLING